MMASGISDFLNQKNQLQRSVNREFFRGINRGVYYSGKTGRERVVWDSWRKGTFVGSVKKFAMKNKSVDNA
jgi:hypothetical protein